MKVRRVTRQYRCPVCSRPDWCCILEQWVQCMRVESSRPCKSGGWLHPIGDGPAALPPREPEKPTIDARKIMLELWRNTTDAMRQRLASSLGVSAFSLRCIGACWHPDYNAWAFPMMNGMRECVGIRLRSDTKKWAVTGSRQGVFIPKCESQATAVICEGPTDTAAAVSLGLFAIGEPSCNACISYTQVAINRLGVKRAIVIADNDSPGIRGAKALLNELQVPCCSLPLPAKDLRTFAQLGGTRDFLDSLISQLVWKQPC